MAFTKVTDDVANISKLSDRPNLNDGLTAAQLKSKFDEAGVDLKTYINDTLIAELESTTDSASGADNIGATAITGVTGATVQTILEDLKTQINTKTPTLNAEKQGFDTTTPTPVSATGDVAWNTSRETLDVKLSTQVTGQMFQENHIFVRNTSGSPIADGTLVMRTGINSDRITVAPAVCNGSVPATDILGVATETISNNANGRVTVFGEVSGLDTSAYTIGTELWGNPSVAGGLTSTKPSAPNLKVSVGIVTKSHGTNGILLVQMNHGSVLGGTDSNVELASLTDKDLLSYESATGIWKNKTIANAGAVALVGDQTVAGVKTFSSSPVIPSPTTDMQAATKKYVDDKDATNVHLTGNETVAGVKTFSSSPIVPTPTTDMQTSTKKYVDDTVNTHKSSADHDGRYYTEFEINGKVTTLEMADSSLLSNINTHKLDTNNPHTVTKAQVGLGNVDNESKATMFTSPAFTGTPTAPTPTTGDNTTKLATTQFVQASLSAGGYGDMLKAVYDPTTVNGDAFDMDNMAQGTTKLYATPEEKVLWNNNVSTWDEIPSTPLPRDADTLNGQLPSYYATADKFYNNAGAHNSIYRGKYLGTSVTADQYTAISSGAFTDLYIGDYWTIGGVNYRIAGFNYFYNCGDTRLTTNHAVIVPDTVLYNAQMNTTNVTTGAYVGSAMRTANLASAISTIGSAFSGHVLTHRQLLANATTSGQASGWAWYDASVEIMNEVMVYGTKAWSGFTHGFETATSSSQLPLFALDKTKINTRQTYWLRDVNSASDFACVHAGGDAGYYSASVSFGVRPAFSIS